MIKLEANKVQYKENANFPLPFLQERSLQFFKTIIA
jgi:hypothetical protein